jgi:hypothetical protein
MVCQLEDTDNFNGIAIDVPDCFNPPPTGLGLYLSAGSQTPTPPSLSASLPNTPGSWTSQVAMSVEGPHLSKSDTWSPIFEDFTSLPDLTMAWNKANPFAPQKASEVHCYVQGSPQESTGHTSALLPCQRTSIPTSYPNTSECYRPDGLYPATRIERVDDWFESFPKFDISPSVGTAECGKHFLQNSTQEGVISVAPTDPSPVDSYQLVSNPFCPFTSTLASPNIHQSSDLPSSGKALRMNSLPGQAYEDLYEKAKQSVARTRKRRRMSTPTKANYVCHICGRPFTRNYNLQIHLPTHAPDRPKQWPCEWKGCDKVFTRRTDLVRHEKCVSASEFRQIFDC